jgi:UDPglucose 6-dehydrogenase
LSNAILLSQFNEVIGVDISQGRVDSLNAKKLDIIDDQMAKFLAEKELNLSATTDLSKALYKADYVIVSTPTNFDENTNCFDTSSVESVIEIIVKYNKNACVVIKSTVPIGFSDAMCEKFQTNAVIFSPEFLREGSALYDNLNPSRIIVGENSERGKIFASLLKNAATKKEIDILLTGDREAEAIKLFANTYLAMRVAFFNELDNFAMSYNIDASEIIQGISLDARIGSHYNNPSFGYGGYCLPKDTKQLVSNYSGIPQELISAIVKSNEKRKEFLCKEILKNKPNTVGIYRLIMKSSTDNFREAAVQDIIGYLKNLGIEIIIYEPILEDQNYNQCKVINNFEKFSIKSDIILANRNDPQLNKVSDKVFTRDIFGSN